MDDLRALSPDLKWDDLVSLLPQTVPLQKHFFVAVMPVTRIATEQVQEVKKRFDGSEKLNFLTQLALKYPDDLEFLGWKPEEINFFADFGRHQAFQGRIKELRLHHSVMNARPGKYAGCTVDHMRPAFCGGTNEPENLSIIPRRIHDLKTRLEQTIRRNSDPRILITMLPLPDATGVIPSVPRLPDQMYC